MANLWVKTLEERETRKDSEETRIRNAETSKRIKDKRKGHSRTISSTTFWSFACAILDRIGLVGLALTCAYIISSLSLPGRPVDRRLNKIRTAYNDEKPFSVELVGAVSVSYSSKLHVRRHVSRSSAKAALLTKCTL